MYDELSPRAAAGELMAPAADFSSELPLNYQTRPAKVLEVGPRAFCGCGDLLTSVAAV